jgi:tetratricopeptide (TPR) repeat protein
MLASGGFRTIGLWDVKTRQRIGALQTGSEMVVKSLAFSPDGSTLASGSENGTIMLWDLSLASWRERACRVANRNFSYSEWRQLYLSGFPYPVTCAGLPIHPTFLEAGRKLAIAGDVRAAVELFQEALKLDPKLGIDPTAEANKFAARGWVTKAKALGETGHVNEAIALFEEALKSDPSLSNDIVEAKKQAAPRLIARGRRLVEQRKVKEAIEAYRQARSLDPSLISSP